VIKGTICGMSVGGYAPFFSSPRFPALQHLVMTDAQNSGHRDLDVLARAVHGHLLNQDKQQAAQAFFQAIGHLRSVALCRTYVQEARLAESQVYVAQHDQNNVLIGTIMVGEYVNKEDQYWLQGWPRVFAIDTVEPTL